MLLLGNFAVLLSDVPTVAGDHNDIWRRTHPRRLVQLVGSQRRGCLSRSEVMRALWPNLDDAHARNRLHHTLHLIRKCSEASASKRPLIELRGDSVVLADGVNVDVAEFLDLVDKDGSDQERLRHLTAAISLYKGDLAPDWLDDHGIESRRVAIRVRYLQALAEAAEICRDAGDVDQAVDLSLRRVQSDPIDIEAHVEYATLLADIGRYDLAAAHCQTASKQVSDALDTAAARPLAELLAAIQRRSNRSRSAVEKTQPTVLEPRPAALGKQMIEAPKSRLYGRDALIDELCRDLDDPYHSIITLCGPPGSGRTTLALSSATRMQPRLRDGAIYVACDGVQNEDALLRRIASELRAVDPIVVADFEQIAKVLCRREMLILLDDVEAAPSVTRVIASLSIAARDCRFLICGSRRLRLAAERAVRVEFLYDGEDSPGSPSDSQSSAARSLLIDQVRAVAPMRRLDERYMAGLTHIATLVEGWPLALVVVGQRLGWSQPHEVIAWLKTWQAATDVGDEPLEKAMVQWVDGAAESLPVLVKAACFEGWFARTDLAALLDGPPRTSIDRFFDSAFEAHLLKRRTLRGPGGDFSEYRIPFLVRNWLRARSLRADRVMSRKRHAQWLQWKLTGGLRDPSITRSAHLAMLVARWHADIDAATRFLVESGDCPLLLQTVQALLPGLRLARDLALSVTWVSRALESPQCGNPLRAQLRIERAMLHSRMGKTALAYEDAQAAYRLSCELGLHQPKLKAAELLQTLGRETCAQDVLPVSTVHRHPLIAHGIEAGENLLRIARVSAQFGEFSKASELSSKAIEVFRYFNCPIGEIRALRYRGRMAFAVGNLDAVEEFGHLAARLASDRGFPAEKARAQLIVAEVALARQDFAAAIRGAGLILSSTYGNDPAIHVRSLKVLAWGHYLDGQGAVAELIQRELASRADSLGDPSHIANSHLLRALLASELHGPEDARSAIGLLHSVLLASPGAYDAQWEWSEVAYLSARLDRPSTAIGLLCSLASFESRPGHTLRPLTRARVEGVQSALASRGGRTCPHAVAISTRDALADLIAIV